MMPSGAVNADLDLVVVGRVSGVFGTRGWLKIYSYTRPRENIMLYSDWTMVRVGGKSSSKILQHKKQGPGLVALLDGISDRDAAIEWVGADITIDRATLPPPAEGEHYWADLVGLEVRNLDGLVLGRIEQILATGANDVIVVQGSVERLIPYVADHYIIKVNLKSGEMLVDWHSDD